MKTMHRIFKMLFLLLSFTSALTPPEYTVAATCTVDRLTDAGDGEDMRGDLRYCIMNAISGKDIITFEVEGTINVSSPLPPLNISVTVEGPGPNLLTVRGNRNFPICLFSVEMNATVFVSGLTISDGTCGIFNLGTLTVNNCAISNHLTFDFSPGITNLGGTVTLANSTISNNGARASCGGLYNEGTMTIINSTLSGNDGNNAAGAICNRGPLTINNSTISGNQAASAGGILNEGRLTINNSTITNNSANKQGGGIENRSSGTINMRNTILAGNRAFTGPDLRGRLNSSSYNLIGNSAGGEGYDRKTDLLDVDPRLGPLQDNGGPTRTHALMEGSPAIDAGDNTDAPEFDQRGEGFPRIVNGISDIGAFEVQKAQP